MSLPQSETSNAQASSQTSGITSYSPIGLDTQFQILPPAQRRRIELNRSFVPIYSQPGAGSVCNNMPFGAQGTVVHRDPSPNGFSLVVMDYWVPECENDQVNRRIGFVPNWALRESPVQGAVLPAGFTEDDVLRRAAANRPRSSSGPRTPAQTGVGEVATGTTGPSGVSGASGASGALDPNCPTRRQEALSDDISGISDLIRFLTHQTAGIKSDREIDRYIACHGRRHPWGPAATRPRRGQPRTPAADRDGDPVRDYMNDYRGLIRTAGQAFDVPPALLTCLIFRESQFEARNRSHTGARGLGQQIGQNVQFINDTITRRPGNHHFRPVVANRWRDYFQQVETSRRAGHVSRQAVCSGRFESRDDANCAAASIAAASVYIDHIRRDLLRASRTQSIEWENALDFYLVIAAAYNMGDSHGRAVARMGNVNTWLQAIKGRAPSERKHREVLGHVRAIRNCLAANNWEGLADRDPDFTEAQCTDRARARGL